MKRKSEKEIMFEYGLKENKKALIKGHFQYMTVPQYNKLIIQLAKEKREKEKLSKSQKSNP